MPGPVRTLVGAVGLTGRFLFVLPRSHYDVSSVFAGGLTSASDSGFDSGPGFFDSSVSDFSQKLRRFGSKTL